MDCSLVVRMQNSIRSWKVDYWTVLAAIATLSAEPENEKEFMHSVERYGIEHRLKYRGQKLSEIPAMPTDESWCVIDLVGRTIILAGDCELPPHQGALEKDESDPPGGSEVLWFALSSDWIMERDADDWRKLLETRHQAALPGNSSDVRNVLWGCPLLEHLAKGLLAVSQESVPDEQQELFATRKIHAEWLMTARGDLGDRSPREILLEKSEAVDLDLFHRSQQWSMEGRQPSPLSEYSRAYRCAGFGMIQIVFYFDMIRAMLADGWSALRGNGEMTLHALVEHLVQFQQQWLDSPNEETGRAMTPRRLMDAERKRIPVTTTESDLDCDCPLCQAQADGFFGASGVKSVGFMMFDAHHMEMEDEFAFSTIPSLDEWERQQENQRELSAAAQAHLQQRKLEATAKEAGLGSELQSVWKSTYVNWDGPPLLSDPFAEGAMQVGFCLCEIIGDLKRQPGGREHLVRLNDSYRDFRRSESSQAQRGAADRLCNDLESAAGAFPELMAKSADLQSHIHELMRSLE